MQIIVESISPRKAENILNHNVGNRKLREGLVERYAEDMKLGRWTECPEPISFYDDETLADGQHRLWAIVESNTTQKFPVCRGLPREAGLNINTGRPRTLVDNAKISGIDTGLSNELLACGRAMEEGATGVGKGISGSAKLALLDKHREAAQWAVTHGPRGRWVRNSLILAAVGRACYHTAPEDLGRLEAWCEVMTTGMPITEHDKAAVVFRNYLLSRGHSLRAGPAWRDGFLKAQNSIWHFMARLELKVVKTISEERYPLPKATKK